MFTPCFVWLSGRGAQIRRGRTSKSSRFAMNVFVHALFPFGSKHPSGGSYFISRLIKKWILFPPVRFPARLSARPKTLVMVLIQLIKPHK
jgi:hypothetical protein